MYIYIHTYIHAYIHTYIHTHTHIYRIHRVGMHTLFEGLYQDFSKMSSNASECFGRLPLGAHICYIYIYIYIYACVYVYTCACVFTVFFNG